ncbi:tyrosine-type recombinase/integrase [Nocardioides pinisoli]|uniref:Tyrosine-type recombinase/integrase n=1 Tax=Nocardioides pinisoli TaxID=2950279 RepID=A0ABT1KRM0_9ACTN|nr:site-specific integrase [Nocardioides pinisoli]MCP3420312.1 tyrosine-type recombinase/integrase [Nocardioides pinisoli]
MSKAPLPIGSHGKITTEIDAKKGHWVARTSFKDPDGVTRPVRGEGPTKGKAEAKLRENIANRRRTSGAIGASTKVNVVADEWFKRKKQSIDADSIPTYEWALKHVRPRWGNLRVRDVVAGEVEKWLLELEVSHQLPRTVLKQIMELARKYGAIDRNPVDDVGDIVKPRKRKKPRALKPSELLAVRDAITAWENQLDSRGRPRYRAIPLRLALILELVTGTRIGEVLAINWCDIDLDTGVVDLSHQVKFRKGEGLIRKPTKTEAGEREVHSLPAPVIAMLRALLSELPPGTERSDTPVLRSRTGGYLTPHNVRRAWTAARKLSDVDLSWVSPHSLRKTAGTSVGQVAGSLAGAAFLGQRGTKVFEEHYWDPKRVLPDLRVITGGLVEGWSDETGDDKVTRMDPR